MIVADLDPFPIGEKDSLHEVWLHSRNLIRLIDASPLSRRRQRVVGLVVGYLARVANGIDLLGYAWVEVFSARQELRHLHEFIATWPFCRGGVQHHPDHRVQVF